MKKLIILTAVALFTFSFQIEAQTCNQGERLARKTWQKWTQNKPPTFLVPGIYYMFKHDVSVLKNAWSWIAQNGGKKIGPRLLEIDEGTQSGTIMEQTKRTFVTAPSFYDQVKITVNKFDGKAETGVRICVQGKDGITSEKVFYTFQRGKNGKKKTFTLDGVRGKVIIIAIKNKSVGNKFKYRIKGVSTIPPSTTIRRGKGKGTTKKGKMRRN